MLPVKTVARRMKKISDATCPGCKAHPESLGHVLNACLPNMGLMRERHNSILQRLVKAINEDRGHLFVEQAISLDNLRPDILFHDASTKEAVIVDVSIPYESGPQAFEKARSEKIQKYEGLRVWMTKQEEYTSATTHTFIVGALGSWDLENISALRALGISRKYEELCSAEASRDPKVCSGLRQCAITQIDDYSY